MYTTIFPDTQACFVFFKFYQILISLNRGEKSIEVYYKLVKSKHIQLLYTAYLSTLELQSPYC